MQKMSFDLLIPSLLTIVLDLRQVYIHYLIRIGFLSGGLNYYFTYAPFHFPDGVWGILRLGVMERIRNLGVVLRLGNPYKEWYWFTWNVDVTYFLSVA